MQRKNAATFMEILVVVLTIFLMICLLLPVLGGLRRASRSMQRSTQLRGIHAGLVLYSAENNGFYPGIKADGKTIDSSIGLTTQGRISRLIEENYFSLEYARSPSEEQPNTTSYALLQVNVNQDGQTIAQAGRNLEWRDTTNNQSVIVSDRVVPYEGSYTNIRSIHTLENTSESDWRGSVGWNDNHVTFETTSILSTVYGKKAHALDNLFSSPGDEHSGDDAFMVWSGTSSL